ncbi:Rv3235 family protein [Gryllotalpicola sp.]|uniref:Rv3235 family protein n=1 Tax=Gryllotalpicola sp. TaxID=1932787 RepID=UPI00260664BC|nr:Rv3235 family protein [Gryllotalpicola sp.]
MSLAAATNAATKPAFDLDEFFGRQRTTDLPDPTTLITNLARCVVEVFAGAREVEQLARWVTDDVYAHLLRRALIAQRARQVKGREIRRPDFSILSTHTFEPRPGACEATVIVRMPHRVRAIALRLEGLDGRWRASSISVL